MNARVRRARRPARAGATRSGERVRRAAAFLRRQSLALLIAGLSGVPLLASCDLKVELASHRFSSGDVAARSMGLEPPDPWFDLDAASGPAPEQPPGRVGVRIPATRLARDLISPHSDTRPPLLVSVAPDQAVGGGNGFGPLVASFTDGLSIAPAHGRARMAVRRPAWTLSDLGEGRWMPHPAPPKPHTASSPVASRPAPLAR